MGRMAADPKRPVTFEIGHPDDDDDDEPAADSCLGWRGLLLWCRTGWRRIVKIFGARG